MFDRIMKKYFKNIAFIWSFTQMKNRTIKNTLSQMSEWLMFGTADTSRYVINLISHILLHVILSK